MSEHYRNGGREGRPRPVDDWRTPPDFYAALNAEFRFTLDAACESSSCLAPAGCRADLGEDGLLADWRALGGGGAVWCNPPYSAVRPWLERALVSGVVVVLLVPADVSTRWWVDLVAAHAAEVRFVAGRLRFLRADGVRHDTARGGGGLTVPSAVVVYPAGRWPAQLQPHRPPGPRHRH